MGYARDPDNPVSETIEFLEWLHANEITLEHAVQLMKDHCQTCKGCHLTDLEIVKKESGL